VTAPAAAPRQAGAGPRPAHRAGFGQLLRAEWIKFRTVRGWVIGMVIAALVTVGIALLNHSSCGGQVTPNGPATVGQGCAIPLGPGGEAVQDSYNLAHQPLPGDGSITARLTSLASQRGLQPWAKAGIIITASTKPGAPYAAVLAAAGHGVRMQYDYTGDIAGPPGAPSAAAPRWLRLTRAGGTLTGYDSADGRHWTALGTVHLPAMAGTVQAGLFASSPGTSHTTSQSISGATGAGESTLATGRFDHVSLRGQRPGGNWAVSAVGGGGPAQAGGQASPSGGAGPASGFGRAGGVLTVTGSGDIAPYAAGAASGGDGTAPESTLQGVFAALIAVLVVAALFMTAEYRRGLIRVTFAAHPRRGQVLAAKAIVAGAAAFVAGVIGSAAAMALGERLLRANGNFVLPVSALTEVRVVAGTAAVLALTAVLAVGLGAILRHGAAAVTALIAGIVVPYFFAAAMPLLLPAGVLEWLLRVTPAAGFAIQQTLVRYPQVAGSYTPANGYYPLAPWAGFAVLCGYAAVLLGLAVIALRRRDA
jgi:ABC-type transport system involved in multi-copper enzyme maturation permease subunit